MSGSYLIVIPQIIPVNFSYVAYTCDNGANIYCLIEQIFGWYIVVHGSASL